MEINKCNQLVLTESDEILEEQFECPVCKNSKYSSLYMEKISSKNMLANYISIDSYVPPPKKPPELPEPTITKLLFCKCSCGNSWLEKVGDKNHRPFIKNTWMRNF